MTSITSELPTDRIVEVWHDLSPSVPDIAPLRDAADPVVERINEALGRNSRRMQWRWIAVGALGVIGMVALVRMARRRRADLGSTTEEEPIRLAS